MFICISGDTYCVVLIFFTSPISKFSRHTLFSVSMKKWFSSLKFLRKTFVFLVNFFNEWIFCETIWWEILKIFLLPRKERCFFNTCWTKSGVGGSSKYKGYLGQFSTRSWKNKKSHPENFLYFSINVLPTFQDDCWSSCKKKSLGWLLIKHKIKNFFICQDDSFSLNYLKPNFLKPSVKWRNLL